MLRDGMNKSHGLASVAHEMRVACHLMGRGYDVRFNDMEGGTGFDFLATKDQSRTGFCEQYMMSYEGRRSDN